MTMNKQEIKKWNEKTKALEDYIAKEFPNGCSKISVEGCDKCRFSDDSLDHLCNIIARIAL